nr:unnamed protein product [Callosobruchus analis]
MRVPYVFIKLIKKVFWIDICQHILGLFQALNESVACTVMRHSNLKYHLMIMWLESILNSLNQLLENYMNVRNALIKLL